MIISTQNSMFTKTDRQTDRERERQRQTERQETQRERHRRVDTSDDPFSVKTLRTTARLRVGCN